MLWRSRKAPAPPDKVWLLGSRHPNADNSIGWEGDLSGLGKADVLIVDMTTLTEDVLVKIAKKLDQAHKSIRDRFLSGGTIVVITHPYFSVHPRIIEPSGKRSPYRYSNYHILPAELTTVQQAGAGACVGDKNAFKVYVEGIDSFSFYIDRYDHRIDPNLFDDASRIGLAHLVEQGIKDYSGHYLGFTLVLTQRDEKGDSPHPSAGRLVFLPPPTEPSSDGIGKILSVYGKGSPPAEAPRGHAEKLQPDPAGKCGARGSKPDKDGAKTQDEIDDLQYWESEIHAHSKLLYSKGQELEDAVVRAFKVLGLSEITRIREDDREDAAFGMGGTGYLHGVIEVRGYEKEAEIRDLLQCDKWAERRAESEGRPSKGIFVPNQYCERPYPASLRDRTSIDPDLVKQAEISDICIIPSCVLFKAVRRVIEGRARERAGIVDRIAAAKGVLEYVF